MAFSYLQGAQHSIPPSKIARTLNRMIEECKYKTSQRLKFVALDHACLHTGVFIDKSFKENNYCASQLRFAVSLVDTENSAIIPDNELLKCKPISRSLLDAKRYAFVLGFD